jgi:hypothetical protein
VPNRVSAAVTPIIDVKSVAHIGISARIGFSISISASDGTTRRDTWSHATTTSEEQHQCSASIKIKHRRHYREGRHT